MRDEGSEVGGQRSEGLLGIVLVLLLELVLDGSAYGRHGKRGKGSARGCEGGSRQDWRAGLYSRRFDQAGRPGVTASLENGRECNPALRLEVQRAEGFWNLCAFASWRETTKARMAAGSGRLTGAWAGREVGGNGIPPSG